MLKPAAIGLRRAYLPSPHHGRFLDFSLAMDILKQWRLDSYRYERGALKKAASDPTVEVDVTALRYARWEAPSPL